MIKRVMVWYWLLRKLEVQNQGDNNYQDHNNGADNTLVPVHPC